MSFSSEEKVRLDNYAAVGDRVGYYELLAGSGDAYAQMALGVVNGDTFAGAAANLFLVGNCGMEISSNQLASLSLDLLAADYDARQSGVSLGWQEIQRYHNTVFSEHHIPADAWTPNYVLNLLESDAQKEWLWDSLLTSYSFFAWVDVVKSVLFEAGKFDDPDAYDYVYRLSRAGASSAFFQSNDYGLYDVVTDGGTHVIGHDEGSGQLGGTSGSDVIMGFDGDDVLSGGDGADYLHGGEGADHLLGGAGADELNDDGGEDVLDGGEGDDVIFLTEDGDRDVVIVGEGRDHIVGGDAEDRLVVRASNFWIPTTEWIIDSIPWWWPSRPASGATGLEPDVAARTGIPLLGAFKDPERSSYFDWWSGHWVESAHYVPSLEAVVAPIFEGIGAEGAGWDRYASSVGPSPWSELSVFVPHSNEPWNVQGSGSVTSTADWIVSNDISYELTDDAQLTIRWFNPEREISSVVIEDFQEGDFGIRFFDLKPFQQGWLNFLFDQPQYEGEGRYAADAAGIDHIHNGGAYVDLPEAPGQLQAPAYGGQPLHASLSAETPGITAEIGAGHDLAFEGSAFDDTVVFTGGTGAFARGGLGDDTVVFSGLVSDYFLWGEGDRFTVANAAGDSFRFSQFEAMQFGGGATLSLISAIAAFHHQPGDTWAQPEALGTLFAPPGLAA